MALPLLMSPALGLEVGSTVISIPTTPGQADVEIQSVGDTILSSW